MLVRSGFGMIITAAVVALAMASCGDTTFANGTGDAGADASDAAACPDVQGSYLLAVDKTKSSATCSTVFGNPQCRVTQSVCTLTWSCTMDEDFQTSSVDSSGKSMVTILLPGGAPAGACTVLFSNEPPTFNCSFGSLNCQGNVSAQDD